LTCIVGLEHNGEVWIGGDSIAIDKSLDYYPQASKKVFRLGEIVLGVAGGIRTQQILKFGIKVPPQRKESDEEWLTIRLMSSIRDAFRKEGVMKTSDGMDDSDCICLLGYNGRLYTMEGTFSAIRSIHPFQACGSGAPYAIGAMHALRRWGPKTSPSEMIRASLLVAASSNAGVREPFTILKV